MTCLRFARGSNIAGASSSESHIRTCAAFQVLLEVVSRFSEQSRFSANNGSAVTINEEDNQPYSGPGEICSRNIVKMYYVRVTARAMTSQMPPPRQSSF